jgi:hypothetical protein
MRVEELERELRAERPEPGSDFARRLDEWAAAGFPRDRGLGPRTGGAGPLAALERAWERLRSTSPRRALLPVGAAATFFVIAAVVVVEGSDENGTGLSAPSRQAEQPASSAAMEPAVGEGAGASAEKAVPDAPGNAITLDDARSAGPDVSPFNANSAAAADAVLPPGSGNLARGTENRIIDASAQLRLGAAEDEVQDVANEVVAVTDRHRGIVLSSQVSSDRDGARASFTLEVPYRELDATLSDLSGLADVISRTEAGQDITAQAVRARKDLAATFERIRAARIDLIEADTHEERQIIRARINSLEASADAFEQQLAGVKRQGRFATVAVDVTSDGPAADDGAWSLGDALDDAGRVLEVMGGIALVALAVIVPVALVAAIAWLIAARARRTQRERALDDQPAT